MKKLLAITLSLLMFMPAPEAHAQDNIITIGTGSVTGVYYPAGGAICRLINRGRKEHGIRCFVESTGGSIYNIRALRDGEISFGIVQSDWQYNAYRGEGIFADGPPFRSLRSVFSLHSEMFTVAVAKDSGIKTFADLKGKRVNIGDAGSGMREIMQNLMELHSWSKRSFASASELKPTDAAKQLCDGKLDAMVFAAGHPNGLIQELTTNCGAHIIPVEGIMLINYWPRTRSMPVRRFRAVCIRVTRKIQPRSASRRRW
jgi:TRAP transporter TAXI family solute receptor